MKILNFLLIISFISAISVNSKEVDQCYCSDKCGPRNVGDRQKDNPKFDKEFGQCFCQERDRQNYLKNHCDVKEKNNPSNFYSYCDKNKNIDID